MGADKALLDLGGTPAIGRIAAACRAAACIDELLVVRRVGAAPLPDGLASELPVRVVTVPDGGEMADSLRAASAASAATTAAAGERAVVVFPVDHALVQADTIAAVVARLQQADCGIALPLFAGAPGHPLALRRQVF